MIFFPFFARFVLLIFWHDIISNFVPVFGSCTFFCRVLLPERSSPERSSPERRRRRSSERRSPTSPERRRRSPERSSPKHRRGGRRNHEGMGGEEGGGAHWRGGRRNHEGRGGEERREEEVPGEEEVVRE